MKLFVVIGGWDWEGYKEPEGIYSTREKAEVAFEKAKISRISSYDTVDILEYELDVEGPT